MTLSEYKSVYGPVHSWRYGRSLGIDPLGPISTCSFNCVYCQLGEILDITTTRKIYVPTKKILQDLQLFHPWEVDVITFSGNGEPSLALNLGELIKEIKQQTKRPIVVLNNGTLLKETKVRQDLLAADQVSIKFDGFSNETLRRINRPASTVEWANIWQGISLFRQEYQGHFSIQTMVLSKWDAEQKEIYLRQMKDLQPDEIQLNTPSRPKPQKHQLEGRGNHNAKNLPSYPVLILKCVAANYLQQLAQELQQKLTIPVHAHP